MSENPEKNEDFGEFMARMMGGAGMATNPKDTGRLATIEELEKYRSLYDDRDFAVGTYVVKRDDLKDRNNGGPCNYAIPRPGEPALVVGKTEPWPKDNGYDKETLIILTMHHGAPVRLAVDPVYFQEYKAPEEEAQE